MLCAVAGEQGITVGVLGAGRMGLPVCARLAGAGYRVLAGDRREELAAAVRAAGAAFSASTTALAAGADVLVTVLPGSRELEQAMTAVIPALGAGASWIDLTSASPLVARPLRERAEAAGVSCLEAPMGGGPAAAAAGTLQLYAGGAPATVTRHRTLLEVLGTVHHVGGAGAGYTVKLLINLLWFGQAVAAGEALLLARRAGLELETVRAALASSAAESRFLHEDARALFAGDYLTTFGIDRCVEELDAVAALAGELDSPFEVSGAVADLYRQALERFGAVEGELLAVALLEERAGLRLRP